MVEKIDQILEKLERIEKLLVALVSQRKEKPPIPKVKLTKHVSTLTDQILALREDRFFDTERTITDVKIKLSERGYPAPVTSVSPLLLRLVKKGELKRTKTADGFKYKKS